MATTTKDFAQVLKESFDETNQAIQTMNLGGALVPEVYDYVATTYVAAGNGAGEIETVTYKTGGASGTTVATLTMTYDANNKLSTVTRS